MLHDAEDLAYAAGIIDGEGCIGISVVEPKHEPGSRVQRRKSPSIRGYVSVAMTDPCVPVWLSETFGGSVWHGPQREPNHKPVSAWHLENQRAAAFCRLVVDRLKVKKAQAELVMAYYDDPRFVFKRRQAIPAEEIEARRQYAAQARALNQRGVKV